MIFKKKKRISVRTETSNFQTIMCTKDEMITSLTGVCKQNLAQKYKVKQFQNLMLLFHI